MASGPFFFESLMDALSEQLASNPVIANNTKGIVEGIVAQGKLEMVKYFKENVKMSENIAKKMGIDLSEINAYWIFRPIERLKLLRYKKILRMIRSNPIVGMIARGGMSVCSNVTNRWMLNEQLASLAKK